MTPLHAQLFAEKVEFRRSDKISVKISVRGGGGGGSIQKEVAALFCEAV